MSGGGGGGGGGGGDLPPWLREAIETRNDGGGPPSAESSTADDQLRPTVPAGGTNTNPAPPGTETSTNPRPDFRRIFYPPRMLSSTDPSSGFPMISAQPGTGTGTSTSTSTDPTRSQPLAMTVRYPNACLKTIGFFPFENYTFGTKAEKKGKDYSEAGRIARLKKKFEKEGMQTRVEGIILVEYQKEYHVLFLKRQCEFLPYQLPGGRLKLGENEIAGLKRKLNSRLGACSGSHQLNWQIGDCVAKWWRPKFDKELQPYHTENPKECIKLFVVHLAGKERMEATGVVCSSSLLQLYRRPQVYGKVYSKIPLNLSRYHFVAP